MASNWKVKLTLELIELPSALRILWTVVAVLGVIVFVVGINKSFPVNAGVSGLERFKAGVDLVGDNAVMRVLGSVAMLATFIWHLSTLRVKQSDMPIQ